MAKRTFRLVHLTTNKKAELEENELIYESWCIDANAFLLVGEKLDVMVEELDGNV